MTPSRFRWVADADGTAHAVPVRSPVTRTACGRILADELPTTVPAGRCGGCLARVGLPPAEFEAPPPAAPPVVVRRIEAGGNS